MLRISRRADYAVRVMVAMANQPFGTYVPAPRIGEEMLIPQPFMVKVIGDLKRGGLVMTVAGRSGGLTLARPAAAITLRHIVEAVEGPIMLNVCLVRAGECPHDKTCPAHLVWQRIQQVLYHELEAVSLASLAEQVYSPSAGKGQKTGDVSTNLSG